MYKITTDYRNQNPIKLVLPCGFVGAEEGNRIILSDDTTPDVVGIIIRSYRTPRHRRLAWVQWHGQA